MVYRWSVVIAVLLVVVGPAGPTTTNSTIILRTAKQRPKLVANNIIKKTKEVLIQFSDRTVYGVGQRPLACWDCGFESRQEYGCLSGVNVVCVVR